VVEVQVGVHDRGDFAQRDAGFAQRSGKIRALRLVQPVDQFAARADTRIDEEAVVRIADHEAVDDVDTRRLRMKVRKLEPCELQRLHFHFGHGV